MNLPSRTYPSKILVFGEHTVMMGSGALAIPYDRYQGIWQSGKAYDYTWWIPFINFIIESHFPFLDHKKLTFLKYNSSLYLDIPIGYGLGSSGALTAAIYDLAVDTINSDLADLQFRLGAIESFFHGKSSGYDPLISYLNKGVMRTSSGQMSIWMPKSNSKMYCYLLDSGSSRIGKDQIAKVQELVKTDANRFDKIADLNNQLISSIVEDVQLETFFDFLYQLSIEQYDNMDFLIVPSIKELWRSTLGRRDISIKLCGAGGGGYYLVFSKDALIELDGWNLQEVVIR